MTRNNVVFPQPLGPIIETKSPASTFKLMSERAWTGSVCVSNVRNRLLISIVEDSETLELEGLPILFIC